MSLGWSEATHALVQSVTIGVDELAGALVEGGGKALSAGLEQFTTVAEWRPSVPALLFGVVAASDIEGECVETSVESLERVLDAMHLDGTFGVKPPLDGETMLDAINGDVEVPADATALVSALAGIVDGVDGWLQEAIERRFKDLYG
jgi:hypothetical protein